MTRQINVKLANYGITVRVPKGSTSRQALQAGLDELIERRNDLNRKIRSIRRVMKKGH